MVRVVFIDLEVWKDPERVFQIGAIRRDLKNLGELIRIEGEIKIPKDANKLKNGCFKDKKSGCDCFYAEIDRKQKEKDYTQDAKDAFKKLMDFSLKDIDKSINNISIKEEYINDDILDENNNGVFQKEEPILDITDDKKEENTIIGNYLKVIQWLYANISFKLSQTAYTLLRKWILWLLMNKYNLTLWLMVVLIL